MWVDLSPGARRVVGWAALTGLLIAGVLVGAFRAGRPDDPVTPEELTIPPLDIADPLETYDPVKAGEALPEGFRQLLHRDVIAPVYDPRFVEGVSVDWGSGILVVGVALDDEAKAYPVNFLNVHEMVNDRITGTPILVSW